MFETFESKQFTTIRSTLKSCFSTLDTLKKEFRDKKTLAQLERINKKRIKLEDYLNSCELQECLISDLSADDKQLIKDTTFDLLFCLIKEKNEKSKITKQLTDIVFMLNNICV